MILQGGPIFPLLPSSLGNNMPRRVKAAGADQRGFLTLFPRVPPSPVQFRVAWVFAEGETQCSLTRNPGAAHAAPHGPETDGFRRGIAFLRGSRFDSGTGHHSPDGNSYAAGGENCSLPASPGWNRVEQKANGAG